MSTLSPAVVHGVLVSGGLDSCILLAHLLAQGRTVQPFYIHSGVVWEPSELAATRQFLRAVHCSALRPLVTLHMPLQDVYTGHWSLTGDGTPDAHSPDEAVFLPGRNALLLLKAIVWCQLHGVQELSLAPLGTSPFADASPAFIERFQDAVNWGVSHPVRISLPFAAMNKRQVMELGRHFPLQLTFSCIAPRGGKHCGQCNKCEERRQAFRIAGLPDLTDYWPM